MKQRIRQTTYRLIAALLLVLCALTSFFGAGVPARAAGTDTTQFERTDVLEDLESTEGFSLSKYPYYESEKPEMHVINFVEYCYSFYANQRQNYGLYLYVYNPNAQEIDTTNLGNKVQLAVKYDSDPIIETSAPTDFEKFSLQFCSVSTRPNTERLFYKFKIVDHKSADGKTIAERVNSAARRYDISGIELVTKGESSAREYPLTGNFALTKSDTGYGSFTFTGFAAGYGAEKDAESTLDCKIGKLETVELNVKHTFYRTKTSSKGEHFQNQIDTVYFSVPKRLFDNYGKLQRIKAEWYEYLTKPILVTSNREYYDWISQYIGISTDSGLIPDDKFFITANPVPLAPGLPGHGPIDWVDKGWNTTEGFELTNNIDKLYYIFPTANWCDINEYDPYSEDVEAQGGVSSNRLYEYIKNYDKTIENGYLPIKNGQISADLFEDDIDESRKTDNERGKVQKGYSYYDFDADLDLKSWMSWNDTNPSFWDKWGRYGFWNALMNDIPQESGATIAPIQVITPESQELKLSDTELADNMLINYTDITEFRKTCEDAFTVNGINDEEKYVVVFRFAVSDYYSEEIWLGEFKDNWWDSYEKGQAYLAQETCFFDFDIIQLSFKKDEQWTVIAAVSDPIDVVNAITTPTQLSDEGLPLWAWILIAVVAVIVLILFGVPILKFLLQLLIFIVTAPIKFIMGIVRRFRE